jgi:redox-sensitive bicupin YhaK (pirin superfamily)
MKNRKIKKIIAGKQTIEGAGVRLKRAFGFSEVPKFDPFLLLDDFSSSNPDDYLPGFPWHPHRGIETVTYIIEGRVEHGDSMGNRGSIDSGDVQWMTAGSGIIHQEMPKRYDGTMKGFQLWVNLPAKKKMINPRYQEVKSKFIPELNISEGVNVKLISGHMGNMNGPVKELIVDSEYYDIEMEPHKNFNIPVKNGYTIFAYVINGAGKFDAESEETVEKSHLVLWDEPGEQVTITAGDNGLRFILISGKPLREPVAWRGPIVMNTKEELAVAFREYSEGTFIKSKINIQ